MTFFGIFGQNYFHDFLFKNFQTYFFWNHQLKILRMPPFILFKYATFCFFALVYALNHNFCKETTVWEKYIEVLCNPELKILYFTETCKIGEPTRPPFKMYFIQLMKNNISFDVLKLRLFPSFFKFFDFDVEIV